MIVLELARFFRVSAPGRRLACVLADGYPLVILGDPIPARASEVAPPRTERPSLGLAPPDPGPRAPVPTANKP